MYNYIDKSNIRSLSDAMQFMATVVSSDETVNNTQILEPKKVIEFTLSNSDSMLRGATWNILALR